MIALFELHALCIVSVCLHKTIHFTVFLHRMNCQDQVVLLATLAHPPKCNPIQPLVVKWLLHQRSLLICIGGEMVTTSTESTYMQICIHTYYYYYYYYYYHYGN